MNLASLSSLAPQGSWIIFYYSNDFVCVCVSCGAEYTSIDKMTETASV